MDYSLSIEPGISPTERHELEDKLEEFLQPFGGETTGGGTMMDGSSSDLDFECEEPGFEPALKTFLKEHLPQAGTIRLVNLDDDEEVFVLE